MNFLRDRELAERFRTCRVSEREQMLYQLIFTLAICAFTSMNFISRMDPGAPLSLYDHITDVVMLTLSCATVLICYRTNARGDNCAFVGRYVSISFPVMNQTLLITLIISVIAAYIDNPAYFAAPDTEGMEIKTGPAAVAAITLSLTYYLLRLNSSMKIAAGLESSPARKPLRRPGLTLPEQTAPTSLSALLHNPLHGVCLALFRTVPAAAFNTSWHALWFAFATFLTIGLGFEYLAADAPREFYVSGFTGEFARLGIFLLGAYLACLAFRRGERTGALTTMAANTLVLPWLVTILLFMNDPEWLQDIDTANGVWLIISLWVYAVLVRVLMSLFGGLDARHFIAAGLLLTAICLPRYHLYFDSFWYTGSPATETPTATPLQKTSHESLFNRQDDLLKTQVAAMPASTPGKTDIYGLVFGGYSHEDVFKREVAFVADKLANDYGMKGRVLSLLNHEETVAETPLATAHNLETALKLLAGKMQAEDIALLYFTSHGSAEEGLSITLDYGVRFDKVDATRIAAALDASGIKNRIIFVSSCFSGAMIGPLQNDNTLIMTAAAADKTSFGCSDDADLTYFGDAYFKQALPVEHDLIKAFDLARTHIQKRETDEGLSHNSDPQISIGKNIAATLSAYKAPPVATQPAPPAEPSAAPPE